MGRKYPKNTQGRFRSFHIISIICGEGPGLEALGVQLREELATGKHHLIGTILIDNGYLKIAQVNEVPAYPAGVRDR